MRFRCVIVWPATQLDAQLANVTSRSQRHAFAAPLSSTTPRHLDNPGTSSTQHSLGRRPLLARLPPRLPAKRPAASSCLLRHFYCTYGLHLLGPTDVTLTARQPARAAPQHIDPARSAPRYRALHLSAPLAS
ncbi:hypothetical protein K438DRAFT_1989776 [Mycena galopus ATCC 62051]|nr:hypothetical protein K438DRAFT_1989776 [Mycena galopus ATCC 62051]